MDLDLLNSDNLKEMTANPIYRTTIIASQNKKEKYEDELVLKNSSRNQAISSSSYLKTSEKGCQEKEFSFIHADGMRIICMGFPPPPSLVAECVVEMYNRP